MNQLGMDYIQARNHVRCRMYLVNLASGRFKVMTNSQNAQCPVCDGTGLMQLDENGYCPKLGPQRGCKPGYPRWKGQENQKVECKNCGPCTTGLHVGETKFRPDGTPCTHEFIETNIGRCYNRYDCVHCRHSYKVDSSD